MTRPNSQFYAECTKRSKLRVGNFNCAFNCILIALDVVNRFPENAIFVFSSRKYSAYLGVGRRAMARNRDRCQDKRKTHFTELKSRR